MFDAATAILWQAPLGNIHPTQNFDAADHSGKQSLAEKTDIGEHTVHAVYQFHILVAGLDMNI